MNPVLLKVIERRFWLSVAVAILWGAYVGLDYHYQGLFVTNRDLYPLLIWPSVVLGLVGEWKGAISSVLLYTVVAGTLFARALLGRPLTLGYAEFAFLLTAGSVLEIVPQALLWGCASAMAASGVRLILKKATQLKTPKPEDGR